MESTPRAWATEGPVPILSGWLERFGLHPGGSWSLSWLALFAGGALLTPAVPAPPALVAGCVLGALFGGLTLVGALAFGGWRTPHWILPLAIALGLGRALVWSFEGPMPGHRVAGLYEPWLLFASAFIVFRARLLSDALPTRVALTASLAATGVLEAVDSLGPAAAGSFPFRHGWFVLAPTTGLLEVWAMWTWIARRELRIEQAEQQQLELEGEVERQRRAQELLRRQESWLFEFFEKAPDMLLVLAPDSWRIERCNRKFSETLGYPRRELVGRSLLDFMDPESREAARCLLEAPRRHIRNETLPLRRRDGSGLLALANMATRDGSSSRGETRAVLHDMTRLRMRSAEEVEEDLYRTLAEQLPAAVFHVDREGRCHFVNATFSELTGLSGEWAKVHGWQATVHPGDAERVVAAWQEAVCQGTAFRLQHRLSPREGVTHRVVSECAPLEGRPGEFVGSMVRLDPERAADARPGRRRDPVTSRARPRGGS